MIPFSISLAWCWLQAAIVAVMALGMSRYAMRHSPAAGAAIAWSGVFAVGLLTLLAPLPISRWLSRPRPSLAATPAREAGSLTAAGQASHKPINLTTIKGPAAEVGLAPHMLRNLIVSLDRSQLAMRRHHEVLRAVCGVVALGILVGLARIAWAWCAVHQVCRRSRLIDELRVREWLTVLLAKITVRTPPQVCESGDLANAAVIGWWQPTIVLPGNWRDWSDAELGAALAHELAHVARRDFLLRLVTLTTVAIHCAQPLVYWLCRQLILAQELAADELAAVAVGGRNEYLCALSKLALRQDDRPRPASARTLLPVFSGFLLRRIEMLRAKECSTSGWFPSLLQWSAWGTLAVVIVFTTGIRGLAQSPAAPSDEPMPESRVEVSLSGQKTKTLFRNPTVDPASVTLGDGGGFLVRLGAIFCRADLQAEANAANTVFNAEWRSVFPTALAPDFSLQDIDYIAGDLQLIIKPLDRPTERGETGQLNLGSQYVHVRWQKPLEGQFAAILSIPGTVKKTYGAVEYAELPVIPAFGPQQLLVFRVDDHTLAATLSEETLRRRVDSTHDASRPLSWRKDWEAVDGGLITIVTTDRRIERPISGPKAAEEKFMHDLMSNASQFAIGVDFAESGQGNGAANLYFRCESEEAAHVVRDAVTGLFGQLTDELEKIADSSPEKEKFARLLAESLRRVTVDTSRTDNDWQVRVQVTGGVDISSILKNFY